MEKDKQYGQAKAFSLHTEDANLCAKRQECGQMLQQLRMEHQVSRENIIHLTRISISFVEQIESGKFEHLPGEIFGRGYIRNLCKILSVEPDKYIEAYNQCWQTDPPSSVQKSSRHSTMKRSYRAKNSNKPFFRSPLRPITQQGKLTLFGIAALFALICFYLLQPSKTEPLRPSQDQPNQTTNATTKPKENKPSPTRQPTELAKTEKIEPKKVAVPEENDYMLLKADTVTPQSSNKGVIKMTAAKQFDLTYQLDKGSKIKKSFQPGKYQIEFSNIAELNFSSTKHIRLTYAGLSFEQYNPERDRKVLTFRNTKDLAQADSTTQRG